MLISRGTAPEQQPVEWAHSSKMAKEILTNFYEFSHYAIAR